MDVWYLNQKCMVLCLHPSLSYVSCKLYKQMGYVEHVEAM